MKFNPYHDEQGRFTTADNAVDPGAHAHLKPDRGVEVADNSDQSPTMNDAGSGGREDVAIGGPMFEMQPEPEPAKPETVPQTETKARPEAPASQPPPGTTAAAVAPNGELPGVSPGKSAGGRNMPPSDDPNASALTFVRRAYGGRTPTSITPIGDSHSGAFYATMPDGSFITYRPAGMSGKLTPDNMATVEINDKSINHQNGGDPLKLKFPSK